MPTDRDRAPLARRRLVPLTVFIVAALALLAFAGIAAAEIKIGEGTSPAEPAVLGEADLLKATATYDSAAGSAAFEITTRVAPETMPEEERPEIKYTGGLLNVSFPCSLEGFEAAGEKAAEEGKVLDEPFPVFETISLNYAVELPPEFHGLPAFGAFAESEEELSLELKYLFPGSKSVNGATSTVGATTPKAVGRDFNCAEVVAQPNGAEFSEIQIMFFPLTKKPEPAPDQTITSAPAPAATTTPTAPAPGVLSITKAKKPLKLKVGKWATVKVKVTNAGGSSTTPGSLRLKAAKGVIVKAARQKLPVLQPGESWTVSYKVKLTAKAKKSSTLSLVGAAGSLAAKGSLVLKALGG